MYLSMCVCVCRSLYVCVCVLPCVRASLRAGARTRHASTRADPASTRGEQPSDEELVVPGGRTVSVCVSLFVSTLVSLHVCVFICVLVCVQMENWLYEEEAETANKSLFISKLDELKKFGELSTWVNG